MKSVVVRDIHTVGGVVGLWQCSSCASTLVRVAPVSWNFLKGLDNVLEDTANLLKMACTDIPVQPL